MPETYQKVERQRDRLRVLVARLRFELEALMLRCDGEEGVRADGSNIQTIAAHALLEELETKDA